MIDGVSLANHLAGLCECAIQNTALRKRFSPNRPNAEFSATAARGFIVGGATTRVVHVLAERGDSREFDITVWS